MITITDIDNAAVTLVNLRGKGKFSAGVVLRQLVDQFIRENGGGRCSKTPKTFAADEIAAMRAGNKLEAVRLYKNRTGETLMDSKRIVEQKGTKYLMESGRYGPDGMLAKDVPHL